MRYNEKIFCLISFVLLTALFMTKPAYAYLDPGTGSLIIQTAIGFIIAAGAFIKIYWKKITALFSKKAK